MNKIIIEIRKSKAIVTLTRNQWNYRMNGLIQYLANLCKTIEWNITDKVHKEEERRR